MSRSFCVAVVGIVFACGTSPIAAAAPSSEQKVFLQKSEVATSTTDPGKANAEGGNAGPFLLKPGFQVERIFTVPKDVLGSWVAITTDDKGRLLVSDQGDLGLCRITPAPLGGGETKVERLDVDISAAQGLLYAFDSLYVSVNGGKGAGSGLYRVRDTNGDDQFDEVVKLKDIRGGGEHGPHSLRLSPDGKSIVIVCGNHTLPPFDRTLNGEVQTMAGVRPDQLHATLPENSSSRLPPNWDEDHLLPRQWDGNGHATGILAPGGWIAKTDPDGKFWEVVSSGYRNSFDFDFNADGEIFAYDSDMEWDFGMPWYRPTRVTHATSGSEFGWRSGTAKWPAYYPDSLPPLVDVGPGSPVGVSFGYGTKFPAEYQKALFICDWTFGTMYAIHTTPEGATYRAVKEQFVARTPLPLTDCTVGRDGAMYFTIGGRGIDSELFRVTYVGDESTAAVDAHDAAGAELRALRREIETYHRRVDDQAAAVKFLLPYLSHADRFIRYAARIGLENQEPSYWIDAALSAEDAEALITGAVAVARQADRPALPKLLAALDRLDVAALPEPQQLELLRAWQLAFIRLGEPDAETAAKLTAKLDALYPAKSDGVNRELCTLLVYLKSPSVVSKTLALMEQPTVHGELVGVDVLARNDRYGGTIAEMMKNRPETQKLHYAFVLRNAQDGWTLDQRKAYFAWLQEARGKSGGASYQNFLRNIDNDAFTHVPELDRLALTAGGIRKVYSAPELPKPKGPGHDWTLDELLALQKKEMKGRNFENGRKMFAAARCVVCHRFGGEGGATGPDLTLLAGRFNFKDVSEAIVDPSKVMSDQYRGVIVTTSEGKIYTGRIVADAPESITMLVDPEDPSKLVTIKKSDVEERVPAPQSLMPKDLLKQLNQNETLDLLAYLLSRGNHRDGMFKKK